MSIAKWLLICSSVKTSVDAIQASVVSRDKATITLFVFHSAVLLGF